MEKKFLNPPELKVLLVESSTSIRQLISDGLRDLGIKNIQLFSNTKEAIHYLEVETADWVIATYSPEPSPHTLHLLKLVTEHSRLRSLKVSMFIDIERDSRILVPAFELGLLSAHNRSFIKEALIQEFESLFQKIKIHKGNLTTVSAEYIREFLSAKNFHRSRLALEENLLDFMPGNPQILLHLAEAHLLLGNEEAAASTLSQVEILNPKLKPLVDNVRRGSGLARSDELPHGKAPAMLGIKTCVLIDPDTDILQLTKGLLEAVGVQQIYTFEDGETAWCWIKENPEPQLIIQEWRIPGASGPIIVQRIRQHGYVKVPIIVLSSLIKAEEKALVREIGIDNVLEKPFEQMDFYNIVIQTLQQNRNPTEQKSIERKISRLLGSGRMSEAERMIGQYMADADIAASAKKAVEAEYEFFRGNYHRSRDACFQALKSMPDNIMVLNLAGKALLKLNDYESALKCFEKANRISPLNIDRLLRMAEANQMLGNGEAALNAVAQAKAIDADNDCAAMVECQVKIEFADDEGGRTIMEQLDSGARVVSFMNNRAVSLSRAGKFEEGIELYRRTLATLPMKWQELRFQVSYNLGLAFARYGELEKAAEALNSAMVDPSLEVFKKARSLLGRIKRTMETGERLMLTEVKSSQGAAAEGEHVASDRELSSIEDLIRLVEAKRGDICCYLIFHFVESCCEDSDFLSNMPRFNERQPIEREESFPAR